MQLRINKMYSWQIKKKKTINEEKTGCFFFLRKKMSIIPLNYHHLILNQTFQVEIYLEYLYKAMYDDLMLTLILQIDYLSKEIKLFILNKSFVEI